MSSGSTAPRNTVPSARYCLWRDSHHAIRSSIPGSTIFAAKGTVEVAAGLLDAIRVGVEVARVDISPSTHSGKESSTADNNDKSNNNESQCIFFISR
jgi:hypothetical protein